MIRIFDIFFISRFVVWPTFSISNMGFRPLGYGLSNFPTNKSRA